MKKNILIALTVIVSLCLLYWGIDFLKGINMFKPANYYYASFDNVDGLVQAAPVNVNGFQVGQVHDIGYDYKTNRIAVMLSLEKDLKIPNGSAVTVVSSLTGASTVSLLMAPESAGFINVGDTIPCSAAAGLMDQVRNDILPSVSGILPKVDSIMGSVNNLVGDPALTAAVARLDGITAELARSSQQLNQLMTSLNKNVPGVVSNVNGITGKLDGASANLVDLSASLKQMPLDNTVERLNATVTNLQTLTERLNSPNSSLGLLLNDKSLYQHADKSMASLDSLLTDIKRNPKRYITIKVF